MKYDLADTLGNGVLPTGKVLQYLLTIKGQNQGRHTNSEYECAFSGSTAMFTQSGSMG